MGDLCRLMWCALVGLYRSRVALLIERFVGLSLFLSNRFCSAEQIRAAKLERPGCDADIIQPFRVRSLLVRCAARYAARSSSIFTCISAWSSACAILFRSRFAFFKTSHRARSISDGLRSWQDCALSANVPLGLRPETVRNSSMNCSTTMWSCALSPSFRRRGRRAQSLLVGSSPAEGRRPSCLPFPELRLIA
jgi:hypothetical protein